MTPLRNNLDRAKAGYGEIRYRGDLARDVLGAMAVSTPVINPWRRRAMAIAAAVALSATTFFAGSHFAQPSVTPKNEVAVVPHTEEPTKQATPTQKKPTATVAQAGEFTLVPTLSSVNSSEASAQTASATGSASDFSLSVPSAPMLFSLATLQDQETTTDTTTNDQSEQRS